MIGFADAYRYLLAEPEERGTQQGNCQEEEPGGPEDVLQSEEGAGETHKKQQRRAKAAAQCQARRAVQKAEPPPQTRNVRFLDGREPFHRRRRSGGECGP
jgi:hypothetical protein